MGAVKRNSEPTLAAAGLFPPSTGKMEEGSAWFWRLFGGTIMGAITFLLVTLLNHLNTNVDVIRNQQVSWQKEVQTEVSGLRDRIVKVEEAISVLKESSKTLGLEELRSRMTAIEQNREVDKERKIITDEQIKSIQEDLKKIHRELGAKQQQ